MKENIPTDKHICKLHTKESKSLSSSQCRAPWPTSHTLTLLQPLIWAWLMTGNQLRHTGHTLPCPLCQVTTPETANEREPWGERCVSVRPWVKGTERAICLLHTRLDRVCACCVKTHRTYISALDRRLAGLNIWCRYELTGKYSCSRSSWVRV